MSEEKIQQVVMDTLSTLLNAKFQPGDSVTRQITAGWDSLKHVEIMFALEEELGVSFSDEELARLDSAEAIIEAVKSKHAA